MKNEMKWNGTTLKLNPNDKVIKTLEDNNIDFELPEWDEEYVSVWNSKNNMIFENEFIEQSTNLNLIIKKFNQKNYDNALYVLDNNEMKKVNAKADDIDFYNEHSKKETVYGDLNNTKISVNVLNEVLGNNKKSKLFVDLLVLVVLADSIESFAETFVFSVENENGEKIEKEINFLNDEPLNLYELYEEVYNNEKTLKEAKEELIEKIA